VLAVKDEGEDALAAVRRSSILDRCARRDWSHAGNPAQDHLGDSVMNSSSDLSFAAHANAFERSLSLEAVRSLAPAVFASEAHERTSSKYTFIPTARVLTGLMDVGFVPVEARQTQARRSSVVHARHVLRLRRRFETVELKGAVPEVVFLNSHDGSSAYQLRMGLFRVVCTNGLIVSRAAFPAYCVSHRGDVVEEVVSGALQVAENFDSLAAQVERMDRRQLFKDEQLRFASRALAVRYPNAADAHMEAAQLLNCRRVEDTGNDLFTILNRCQDALLRGGLSRWSANGRLSRSRRITSIKEEVRLNSQLWDLASEVLAA
jgi:hypothetical protein